jgi:hypothetical protein
MAMTLWSKIETVVGYLLGGIIVLFGTYAIYFFIAIPLRAGKLPQMPEVVLALAILSIGVTFIVQIRARTRSSLWLGLANITFWFFSYVLVFNAERLMQGITPSLHSLAHNLFMLSLTIVFGRLAYLNRRRENAEKCERRV